MSTASNPLTIDEADYLLSVPDSELEAWLTELPSPQQKAVLQQLATHQTATERATATPADFAMAVSEGKWKMARHLKILNQELMDIATGRNDRLIVEMPPRHGKSELCSKYFPAWYKGKFPDRNVIVTSATDDLASDFSAAARDIIDEHGPSCFGVRVREDRRASHRWATEGGGDVRAAGVCGGIMGRGCSLLLIDDYFKNVEEALSETYRRRVHQWYHSTSTTRLTSDGAIVVIATRWHPKDLIGKILEESELTGEQWRQVRFPALGDDGAALWPEMFSREWLEKKRAAYNASGYPWMWEALYQQNPPSVFDSEFDAAYFDGDDIWFDDWPEHGIVWRVMVLDPSLGKNDKSDYSAFVMLALHESGAIYVDADLQRRDSMRIVNDGINHYRAFFPHVFGCEFNGFQEVLGTLWWKVTSEQGIALPVKGIHNHENKRVRIRSTLTEYLAKRVFRFRRASSGVSLLLEQLKGFPSHKYDDGPDALEMGVRLLQEVSVCGVQEPDDQPRFEQVYT